MKTVLLALVIISSLLTKGIDANDEHMVKVDKVIDLNGDDKTDTLFSWNCWKGNARKKIFAVSYAPNSTKYVVYTTGNGGWGYEGTWGSGWGEVNQIIIQIKFVLLIEKYYIAIL